MGFMIVNKYETKVNKKIEALNQQDMEKKSSVLMSLNYSEKHITTKFLTSNWPARE